VKSARSGNGVGRIDRYLDGLTDGDLEGIAIGIVDERVCARRTTGLFWPTPQPTFFARKLEESIEFGSITTRKAQVWEWSQGVYLTHFREHYCKRPGVIADPGNAIATVHDLEIPKPHIEVERLLKRTALQRHVG
jgi:hypothetical protein